MSVWPENGLENVRACPVCACEARADFCETLTDNSFNVAPGAWNLCFCERCSSAYLNPRPTPEALPLAYSTYYTHQTIHADPAFHLLSVFKQFKRTLQNDFYNNRFGSSFRPTNRLGRYVLPCIPGQSNKLEHKYRNIPKLMQRPMSLLDIGCGAGAFLKSVKECGWDVVGLDFDEKAVDNARKLGLDVRLGGVETLSDRNDLFDVITLSHVIEHVYDPEKFLVSCLRLLKPGGFLWLETPNIDSNGFRRFGRNWRGLEAPRHLVLFSSQSLVGLLGKVGFTDVRSLSRPNVTYGMYKASWRMSLGVRHDDPVKVPFVIRLYALFDRAWSRLTGARRSEFVTLGAWKP